MRWRFWRPVRRLRPEVARVERKLGRMDPFTRKVFLLHRLDSLGYPEIAERLGIEVAEVERQISRAMFQLIQPLDDD